METLSLLIQGVFTAASPENLFYGFAGVLLGTLVGVLPGLGPAGAIALLLPLALHAPPLAYMIMLFGITYGAQIWRLDDVDPGQHPRRSIVGDYLLGRLRHGAPGPRRSGPRHRRVRLVHWRDCRSRWFGLFSAALAEFGLHFGPPEYAALMLFGLTALVYLAHGPMDKALLMALFGALLASVGLDPVTGTPRFTFNFLVLRDGIGLTPVVIGLFGVSEVLLNLDAKAGEIFQNKVRGLLPTAQDWRDSAAPIARGSLLGFFIGAIPGLNVVIATFASYALEKNCPSTRRSSAMAPLPASPGRRRRTTQRAAAAGYHCSVWACLLAR